MQNKQTDNVTTFRELHLFGKKVGDSPSIPYAAYTLSEKVIFACGGLCRVIEKTYREVRETLVYNDLDMLASSEKEKVQTALLADIPFYAFCAGDAVAEQKKMDNALYTVVYCTVVQRIDSLFMPKQD